MPNGDLGFFVDERQQGQDAGALDGHSQIALLLGRQTGYTTGQDFAALGDEATQQVNVFVVDRLFGFEGRNATTIVSHGDSLRIQG